MKRIMGRPNFQVNKVPSDSTYNEKTIKSAFRTLIMVESQTTNSWRRYCGHTWLDNNWDINVDKHELLETKSEEVWNNECAKKRNEEDERMSVI